jgi:site-specific DNA-methyltransferase (adenine-specific)
MPESILDAVRLTPAAAEEQRLIARVKELSADTLETAIERGKILKCLDLKWHEYESRKIGITWRTAYRLMELVDHPRMDRSDWEKPARWTVCYELLTINDRLFDSMCDAGFVGYHTTRRQIRDFIRLHRRIPRPPTPKIGHGRGRDVGVVNQILCGDCVDLIPRLPDETIHAVVTSPPYAEQRDGYYEGISESDYPEWFNAVMSALRPKLTPDGSVLVVIRPHISDGQVSDYVMRTRLKVREAAWIEAEELVWYKSDGPPLGSIFRPRRAWEQILWFSRARQPFVDLVAGGRRSDHVGFANGENRYRLYHDIGTSYSSGQARRTDVFVSGVADATGVDHPAVYPMSLASALIEMVSRPGDVVLDPFCGSGTTLLVARHLKRKFVGFDSNQSYVDLARSRLEKNEAQIPVPVAIPSEHLSG